MKINQNVGMIDRIVRLVVGAVAMILAFLLLDAADAAAGGIVLAVIGAILILSGLAGSCPGYRLFCFSTKK